jgi:glutamate carboxypeptidase
VAISTEPAFPPLTDNPATQALAVRAKAIYAGIGRTLGTGGNGGASESALASAAGTPALDGLGAVGGGFHSPAEWLDVESVVPRIYLTAKLLMELGANPPARTSR